MEIADKVRAFIRENFYVGDDCSLADDASLLEEGIVDSTGVLEVVAFVESSFGIEVGDDEIVPENLDTIAGIAGFVARKQAASARVPEAS